MLDGIKLNKSHLLGSHRIQLYPRPTKRWVSENSRGWQSFYSPCLQSVAHSLNCNFSGNVPLLHTSKYITEHDQFYQAFPCVSTASDKHWGEKAWVRGYSAYSSSFTSQQSNVTKWRGLDGLVPQWWSALLSTCTLHQLAYLVLAMSTGMDAIVVTRPLIMLAAKWQMMLSLK